MEKLLVTSNFSFSHSVFKRLVLQTHKNQGLFGKGLNKILSGAYLQNYTGYGYEISWVVTTWGKTGISCYKFAALVTCLQYQSFENTVGKGEIAHNEQFLFFPQCFLTIWRNFCHVHQM